VESSLVPIALPSVGWGANQGTGYTQGNLGRGKSLDRRLDF